MLIRKFPRNFSRAAAGIALTWAAASAARADDVLDAIGITQLRAEVPSLSGSGVVVGQAEATTVDAGTNFDHDNYQVAASFAPGIPITYVGKNGNTALFNGALESGHGDIVTSYLSAPAPSLSRIVNINANYYINNDILKNVPMQFIPKVINQSFLQTEQAPFTAAVLHQLFDSYVSVQNAIVVQAAGNGGNIVIPGGAYNVITVGSFQAGPSSASSPGQLAKPDLVAPEHAGHFETSFAAPTVSGVAAIMVQAAGGSGDGVDPRSVKALLLNGAVKPAGWTHTTAVPLDRQFGAGIVNAYNSYHNLIAGEHAANSSSLTVSLGGAHAPISAGIGVGSAGWNLTTITSNTVADAVDHYLIDLSTATGPVTLTATLTWQRDNDAALNAEILASGPGTTVFNTPINTINNLDLFLYDVGTLSLADQSISSIDNVEHIYNLTVAPGIYDLQVLKHGGNTGTADVYSNAEKYAVAWNVTGPGISPVPEPASMVLLGMGGLVLLRRRRPAAR